ncbi:MAG: cytochrome c maturation protein CcmE [Bacillota bacterium]
MKQRHKIIIGLLVIIMAMGAMIAVSIGSTAGYQLRISEVLAKGEELKGRYLLVEGYLLPETVNWDGKKIELRFFVTDGESKMQVVFNDVPPDNLTVPDTQIILKGKYDSGAGVFLADKVETRCPSKYEAAEGEHPKEQKK